MAAEAELKVALAALLGLEAVDLGLDEHRLGVPGDRLVGQRQAGLLVGEVQRLRPAVDPV